MWIFLPRESRKTLARGIFYPARSMPDPSAILKEGPIMTEQMMTRALELATRGHPAPNPRVGAVIFRGSRILGEGFHRRRGEPHAEIEALTACREDPAGATLAVTLEPCCHSGHGKLTPPCTEAIIKAGIASVLTGSLDPNPQVAGGGVTRLRAAGIEVIPGVLEKQCRNLNKDYFHHRRTGKPRVHLKIARTADGFAALPQGGGRITGLEVQKEVHGLRAAHQALLTGSGTVRIDNPRLNVRLAEGKDPLRLVLATNLDIDPSRSVFNPPGEAWIIGGLGIPGNRFVPWEERGVPVLLVPRTSGGKVDLEKLLEELGRREIINLLVEAGPGLAGALLEEGLVDELSLYQSPRSFGRGVPLAAPGQVFPSPKAGLILVENQPLGEDHISRFERRENGGDPCLRG